MLKISKNVEMSKAELSTLTHIRNKSPHLIQLIHTFPRFNDQVFVFPYLQCITNLTKLDDIQRFMKHVLKVTKFVLQH